MKINFSNYSNYLQLISVFLIGLFLLSFPLLFATITTDSFSLPKQFALIFVCLLAILLFGVKSIADKTVKFRRTPFDLPIILFVFAVFLSSILAINKAESLISFASLLFSVLLYYIATNTAKTQKAVHFLLGAFLGGGFLLSLLYILTFFKVYVLPLSLAKSQIFTPIGTLSDQAIYVGVCLLVSLHFALKWKKDNKIVLSKAKPATIALIVAAVLKIVVLVLGLGLTIYALIKLQNPVILPFFTGFQIAFATVSQDSARTILSFLTGSGFGTFAVDFAKFKQTVFNQNPTLWNLTFFRSSTFTFELLATTGVLGLLAFLNLVYKVVKQKPVFKPLIVLLIISFVWPFSIILQTLIFVLLAIYAINQGLTDNKNYFDVGLGLVTLKNGLIAATSEEKKQVSHGLSGLLSIFVFILILIIVGALGFYSVRYAMANVIFQKSLVSASENNGAAAYQGQNQALGLVDYSDAYQRVFSQTNLALANSLGQSNKGSSPSAQTQQTIYTLIQQSINAGRKATDLSRQSAVNWQNLSAIYRNLIGFGKNADAFAVQAMQQAEVLDSANPQEYINLGGLYFQLKLWDKAEEQFKIAINLKPDFANAYYNLAHTLQEKGDLQSALSQLEQVKTLVKNDPTNLKKVQDEIDALQAGIKAQTPTQPVTTLPVQNPPVVIPAPTTPKPTATTTPVPTASPLPLPSSGQATPPPAQ